MKKVIGFILCLMVLGACSRTQEEKANLLIKEDIQKVLVKPDTYEPIETKLDSAFAPYETPEFMENTLKCVQLFMKIKEYKEKIKVAKSMMTIYEDNLGFPYFKNEYNEYKAEYKEATNKRNEIEKRLKRSGRKLKELVNAKREFIGYKTMHHYRADNNAGNTVLGTGFYLFDKDINTILISFSEEEIELIQEASEELGAIE
ncbi:hypothetical protein [Prevotella nigrescens]|uniref:hypothetical protein n=1 Tax=Prevotella nigrescens TaxID=28133 RepID=UPI0002AE9932|nr:hypothetical protein [Prevotella nigrescens]ELX67900.1 hypothetical protein HMPREF0662_00874 [Prevotella nigrescens F0103]QUB53607.1 hypothetical protein J4865_08375 [Prevotella nigrescens F0103]